MKIPCNTHELKILTEYFHDVVEGKKKFELRKDDRNFQVGDFIILREWNGSEYTNQYVIREISYKLDGADKYGLSKGYCILGIEPPKDSITIWDEDHTYRYTKENE